MRTHRGRTDLEEKSSDDEREVYKGTPSEETAMLFARTSAIALCTMCFVATLSQRVQSNLRICTDEQAPRCKLLDYRKNEFKRKKP